MAHVIVKSNKTKTTRFIDTKKKETFFDQEALTSIRESLKIGVRKGRAGEYNWSLVDPDEKGVPTV